MQLPRMESLKITGRKVLLRTDYDVPLHFVRGKPFITDTTRIKRSLPTINYLLGKKAKVIIVSHLGRPGGKLVLELSLEPIAKLISNFQFLISNQFSISNVKMNDFDGWQLSDNLWLLENLRFYPEEEANDLGFAKKLASLADFYINDAFACSHRLHASIVGVARFLPGALGFDFEKEIQILSKVKEFPARPLTVILGGVKKDKLEMINKLSQWADYVLVGGRLPLIFRGKNQKTIVAKLKPGDKDITLESLGDFKNKIAHSQTVVWVGPMGVYEEKAFEPGTRGIAEAIVESKAFSVVGGGDSVAALGKFNLVDKISFVSSGGGAMLEYLARGTLPGIEAIIRKNF